MRFPSYAIIAICSLLFSNSSIAQNGRPRHPIFGWEYDYRPGPRIAFSWQKNPSIEFGVHTFLRSSIPEDDGIAGYEREKEKGFSPSSWWNVGMGAEIPFGAGHFIVGPKLFTELNIGIVSMALNTTCYIGNGRIDPRITPEIGLALLGFFGVRYGYNWAPLGPEFETIGQNRITIFLLLVRPRIHNMCTSE